MAKRAGLQSGYDPGAEVTTDEARVLAITATSGTFEPVADDEERVLDGLGNGAM